MLGNLKVGFLTYLYYYIIKILASAYHNRT